MAFPLFCVQSTRPAGKTPGFVMSELILLIVAVDCFRSNIG